MLQKKHILIFAIPGGIIVLLILTLIVYQAAVSKKTQPRESVSTANRIEITPTPAASSEIPVFVEFGKPLKLALYTDPSTGYQWQVNFDKSYFKLLNNTYLAKGNEKLVGSGGTQYFEFEILKSGKSEIRFEYKKPWETNISPQDVKTYQINISEVPLQK
ncbi:MAG TPA: protease inhibitor I42 family protein [Patescibacteria group bacterium]|nr:protease inhibitor I42 family protein [Patescibacteria group bacterium]